MQPDRGVLSLVLEYMDGGSLQDIVDTGGCAEESVLSHIAKDVLLGLHYLHDTLHQLHRHPLKECILIQNRTLNPVIF